LKTTIRLLSSTIAGAAAAAGLSLAPIPARPVLARMQPGQELMEYVCMENTNELSEGFIIRH
jgi:hypothetical protein